MSRFGPESPTRCPASNTTFGSLSNHRLGPPRAASGRFLGRPVGLGTRTWSITSVKKTDSWRCPAVRTAAIGSPLPSVTRWILVENPPCRTDRFIPESRTHVLVFSGGSVPFLTPKGPPAADRLARIVVLCAPNCCQSIWPSASSSPWSFRAADCRVTFSAQRLNRSWAALQDP